ncbi:MAG: hypothetical protein N2312_05835 [Dictyoglomaceae bacterium]|nr:hypothetical protein [Dictyoglomaceae bacterium]
MQEDLVAKILRSKKYRYIYPEVVKNIYEVERKKFKNQKDILKSIKRRLHQIYGSFLKPYEYRKIDEYLGILSENNLKNICIEILKIHISTKERLSFYEDLYRKIYEKTGIPKNISDLACGLNPFSIPFMNINKPLNYYAYDIDGYLINLVNKFFEKVNLPTLGICQDIIFNPPKEKIDLTFIFKFLPIIEKLRKNYMIEFLKNLDSSFIIISFPLKSLTGREKGMLEHYESFYIKNIEKFFEILGRISFNNEIFIIIKK